MNLIRPIALDLRVIQNLNPDGLAGNSRGADLNRDFGAFSQRETRIARRYARLAGVPSRSLIWPPGSASRWRDGLGRRSFVVELPPGELSNGTALRHARAVLRLSE